MLIKRKTGESARPRLAALAAGMSSGVLDRRSFLRRLASARPGAL